MAINSFGLSCDKVPTKSSCSTNSSKDSCRLLRFNLTADGTLSNTTIKSGKVKKSPYFAGDRVHLLSRVTEKRLVHKKTTDFVSSFPLAVNIYKANSDDFKSSNKKANKKVKKSVLTLPNVPAPMPQVCTVSDMNDSEYCDKTHEDRKQKLIKKRISNQNNRKARVREKNVEFYDRDAQYCSQLNIRLDSSSTDMMKNYNGDGKRNFNKKKMTPSLVKPQTVSNNLSDVWAVLRDMNRFQFRPSPPMSDDSIVPIKKKIKKRRPKRNDTRVIETCRTEEFAYIQSYEVDGKAPDNFSPSSSVNTRITVIDKQNEFNKICDEFEKRLLKTHNFLRESNNNKIRIQKNKTLRKSPKNSLKAIGYVANKENKQMIPLKKKKKNYFDCPADQRGKFEETSNSENRDLLIDVLNSERKDNTEKLLNNTPKDSIFATKGSFIYSDNSGSSKAELPGKIKYRKDNSPMGKVTSEVCNTQSKGISEVVINKPKIETAGISIETNRVNPQNRKPLLVTTMPSSCIMPKLTQTEIKRRLARIKFPIVVLGMDQVNSSIEVMNYDPPQFDGLENHIWPFMADWSDDYSLKKVTKARKSSSNKKYGSYSSDSSSSNSRKSIITEMSLTVNKDEKQLNDNSSTNKKNTEIRRPTPSSELNDKLLQSSKKHKSIVQLKDKMLNFLYMKYSKDESEAKHSRTNIPGNKNVSDENKAVDSVSQPKTFLVMNNAPKKKASNLIPIINTNKKSASYVHPWAKAKWASDFIEKIMKNIRSGVYYTQDSKELSNNNKLNRKDVSVQSGSLFDPSDYTQTCDDDRDFTEEKKIAINQNKLINIPGFNNTLPAFEITTLNMKQIAVKHCVTNIMVQFDVISPVKSTQNTTSITINKSSTLIPVEMTQSHTKIYKCKTTILNGMLPAELCTILPKMINNIIDANVHSNGLPSLYPTQTESCLSTISELTRETIDPVISVSHDIVLYQSPELKRALEGLFSSKPTSWKRRTANKIKLIVDYNDDWVKELIPEVSLKTWLRCEISTFVSPFDDIKATHNEMPLHESPQPFSCVSDVQMGTCTTVAIYTGQNKTLSSSFKPYDLMGMIKSALKNYNIQFTLNNFTSYFDIYKQHFDRSAVISISMIDDKDNKKKISVIASNLKIDSLYEAYKRKRNLYINDTTVKCIDYTHNSLEKPSINTEVNQITSNKNKRKGFYRLYRKCKSTTNIPAGEKNGNTPLNKITNLDDFLQILGSKKMLSTVFDGYSAKKILSSIIEMKNWITEINPKQALLILLLTNKKDTPNLVRFRPILLQGIAVNRITRASELDMEIEVIERENLNKFSQYDGISYLPELVTNYDNLLEELYWIAKTTASDYQRPFDESSERLLKSLLEKRKKLNPSYLRVMARYVGLGLLKSPKKN